MAGRISRMRDQPQPEYLLVGIGNAHLTLWRIQRPDGRVCGGDQGVQTDDGILVSRPKIREWRNADSAAGYMARLEDDSAGEGDDLPVVWIDPPPFLSAPAGPHIDGPL